MYLEAKSPEKEALSQSYLFRLHPWLELVLATQTHPNSYNHIRSWRIHVCTYEFLVRAYLQLQQVRSKTESCSENIIEAKLHT